MLNFLIAKAAEQQVLRGFPKFRDKGGVLLTLAKAIDIRLVSGFSFFQVGLIFLKLVVMEILVFLKIFRVQRKFYSIQIAMG